MPALSLPRAERWVRLSTHIRRDASFSEKLGAVLGTIIGILILATLMLVMCRSPKAAERSRPASTMSRPSRSPRTGKGPSRRGTRARPRRALADSRLGLEGGLAAQAGIASYLNTTINPPMVAAQNRILNHTMPYHPMDQSPFENGYEVGGPSTAMAYGEAFDGNHPHSTVHLHDTEVSHGEMNQLINTDRTPRASVQASTELRVSIEMVAEIRPQPPKQSKSAGPVRSQKASIRRASTAPMKTRANEAGAVVSSSETMAPEKTSDQYDGAACNAGATAPPATRKESIINSVTGQNRQREAIPVAARIVPSYSGAHVLRTPPSLSHVPRHGTWPVSPVAGGFVQEDRVHGSVPRPGVTQKTTLPEAVEESIAEEDSEATGDDSEISLPAPTFTPSRPTPRLKPIPREVMRRNASHT